MGVLVACCFLIGLAPLWSLPILGKAISAWAPELNDAGPRLVTLAPLGWITTMGLLLVAALSLGGACAVDRSFAALRSRAAPPGAAATWRRRRGCSTPRRRSPRCWSGLFGWVLRPRTHGPEELAAVPAADRFP